MMTWLTRIAIGLLLMLPLVCDADDRFRSDVAYSGDLCFDIALPAKRETPSPCIVVIHGGAWRMGNKSAHHDYIRVLAANGYVAATIQYRFCPEHRFPAQVHDVRAAVRYLRKNADEFGIDPNRFGAIGFSAGAHLSMMLGVLDSEDLPDESVEERDVSSKVQAVVSYFGPTDLTAGAIPDRSLPLIQDFIGATRDESMNPFKAASPVTYVDASDSPMLLFQGTVDPLVPTEQAVVMANRLTDAGVPGRVELLVGHGHGWGGPTRDYTERESRQWFDRWLIQPPNVKR